MRQAINNLQATHSGFGFVNSENVFKVCDQPHPLQTKEILNACLKGIRETKSHFASHSKRESHIILPLTDSHFTFSFLFSADIDQSLRVLHSLWAKGYSASDIMSTLFRVVKQLEMAEHTKLSFIREIALVQMRVAEGCATVLQISALLARLCRLVVWGHSHALTHLTHIFLLIILLSFQSVLFSFCFSSCLLSDLWPSSFIFLDWVRFTLQWNEQWVLSWS